MKKICRVFTGIVLVLMLQSCNFLGSGNGTEKSVPDSLLVENMDANGYRFYVISDWGFNGYYSQTDVANTMIRAAKVASPKFIVSCGDNFQTNGVQSTSDPLWRINFEEVYDHPVFNIDWFPVLGNHDYKGSTQAILDYSNISRRWRMPSQYYTFSKRINDSITARFVFIDTPALLPDYRNNPEEYPDAEKQDSAKQISWLTSVLSNANENWIFVFGHHPVYSASKKHGSTLELIEVVKPLLEKYSVDFYMSGHDHDFQHLKPAGSKVDYFVTGTGGNLRENSSNEHTIFSISKPGFSILSLRGNQCTLQFIGAPGEIIYKTSKTTEKK